MKDCQSQALQARRQPLYGGLDLVIRSRHQSTSHVSVGNLEIGVMLRDVLLSGFSKRVGIDLSFSPSLGSFPAVRFAGWSLCAHSR